MRLRTARYLTWILLTAALFGQTVNVSAPPLTDSDIQLLRSNVQSDKNNIIAHNMRFTDPEAAAFWPVYRDYVRDQEGIADTRLQLITEYAKSLDSMDDPKAKDLAQRMIKVDGDTLNLREKYWPRFEKALGPKRAAKFYQIDNRLSLIINMQLASQIPLIP